MNITKTFKFEKESDNRWYVVLPEWEGDHADLEMVMGADCLLDLLSQGEDIVHMTMSTANFENHTGSMLFNKEESDGGWYYLDMKINGIPYEFEVWLCKVTKFVFGELPRSIYFCKS